MTPTEAQLDQLPLVLAGPILRRVQCGESTGEVSVWVALRDARRVHLTLIYPDGSHVEHHLDTVGVGTRLHVAVVTVSGISLPPDRTFTYDLRFEVIQRSRTPASPPNQSVLADPGVISVQPNATAAAADMLQLLTYGDYPLPSFRTPPEDVSALRLVHGSCRDIGYDGHDAMVALDLMIARSAHDPNRPHLCVLSGDQVYADHGHDEHSGRLAIARWCSEMGEALFGWHETIPETGDIAADIPMGEREYFQDVTGIPASPRMSFTLSEFCATHLLWWSKVLWSTLQPPSNDVLLDRFLVALEPIRRALANVPVFMTFDDHDVVNNWNLLRGWCDSVYKTALGRRVMTNGVLACALFQQWGNDPRQPLWQAFRERADAILTSIQTQGDIVEDDEAELVKLLGLPDAPPAGSPPDVSDLGEWHRPTLTRQPVPFHFVVRGPGWELIGLDARTWRKFQDDYEPSDILSDYGLEQQMPEQVTPRPLVTFVVASVLVVEYPLTWYMSIGKYLEPFWNYVWKHRFLGPHRRGWTYLRYFAIEVGDSWDPQSFGFERLLAKLATRTAENAVGGVGRVILLVGDNHIGNAARLHYRARWPYREQARDADIDAIFAQFISSGCMREDSRHREGHRLGYDIDELDGLPSRGWFGWHGNQEHIVDWQDLATPRALDQGLTPTRTAPSALLISKDVSPGVRNLDEQPHWRYRIDYILAELDRPTRPPVRYLPGAENQARRQAATKAYMEYASEGGSGREIVGRNNFGEVLLEGSATRIDRAVQVLWWSLTDGALPQPLSRFVVTFDPQDETKPMFTWPVPR